MAIIVGAVIGIILLVLLCGIGIYQVISKKPAIFFAGERRYREDELKSVRLWNVEHGLIKKFLLIQPYHTQSTSSHVQHSISAHS